jgi:hypothetical protein
MVRLPSSMLFMGRRGVRAVVPARVMRAKLERGIAAAVASGGTFHLWFHPSNFYHSPETQFGLLDHFLRAVRCGIDSGRLTVRTMADFTRTARAAAPRSTR